MSPHEARILATPAEKDLKGIRLDHFGAFFSRPGPGERLRLGATRQHGTAHRPPLHPTRSFGRLGSTDSARRLRAAAAHPHRRPARLRHGQGNRDLVNIDALTLTAAARGGPVTALTSSSTNSPVILRRRCEQGSGSVPDTAVETSVMSSGSAVRLQKRPPAVTTWPCRAPAIGRQRAGLTSAHTAPPRIQPRNTPIRSGTPYHHLV
jgi:hypothetical protein